MDVRGNEEVNKRSILSSNASFSAEGKEECDRRKPFGTTVGNKNGGKTSTTRCNER